MMIKPVIKKFNTAEKLSLFVAGEFVHAVREASSAGNDLYVALSGGSTPQRLFRDLARPSFRDNINWTMVQLFWGDERCVPPDNEQSNYRMTRLALLDEINIPEENVHRIHGEADPEQEAKHYSGVLRDTVPLARQGWPQFDWIFLGMGEDGHTASLFPGADTLKVRDKLCVVATHPQSGQHRISMTLPVLNQAKRISFLITGSKKRAIVNGIMADAQAEKHYPSAMIQPLDGRLEWYIDLDAGADLPV
jgi:6-phosphogluconolactonase